MPPVRHGAIESPGGYCAQVEFDLHQMYVRGARAFIEPLDLLAEGRIDPASVLGPPLPMDQADLALVEPSTKPLFVRDRLLGRGRPDQGLRRPA
jgi:hypothetical protein